MATGNNDLITFIATSADADFVLTNPYSGAHVTIQGTAYYWDSATEPYDGLGGVDTMLFSNYSDILFLEDAEGGQKVKDIEVFVCGNGNDVINFFSATYTMGNVTVSAGPGNDLVWLNAGSDSVYGNDGNDTLDGGLGHDSMTGNNQNDSLTGNEGDDTILGGAGLDTMEGGNGNDTVHGGEWRDLIFGDEGDDTLYGAAGNDTLHGGIGNDSLEGVGSYDQLHGGEGDDTLNGGSNDDTLNGDAGNDSLFGNANSDALYGGDNDDTLDGGSNNDILDGGSGNDIIKGNTNADTMSGEAGADIFLYTLATQAGNGADKRDVILDFSQTEGDVIDISTLPGNFAFRAGGNGAADFTGSVAQIVFQQVEGNTLISVDSDGNNLSNFQIELIGIHNLIAEDFLL